MKLIQRTSLALAIVAMSAGLAHAADGVAKYSRACAHPRALTQTQPQTRDPRAHAQTHGARRWGSATCRERSGSTLAPRVGAPLTGASAGVHHLHRDELGAVPVKP